MAFISVTRLRIRSLLYLPQFFLANEASAKEVVRTPGLLAGKELIDKNFTFWTVTMWEDIASMKKFRSSPAHRKAMQKLPDWCNEATYVHWEQDEAKLPDWNTVYEILIQDGIVSKVRYPSPRHSEKNFPAPVWTKIERPFKPKSLSSI